MTVMRRRGVRAVLAALPLVVLVPAVALAHPLGNFTINHFAGIRVSPTEVRLDVVVDQAEVPTFQERLKLDADADGELSPTEVAAAREPACRNVAANLDVTIEGRPVELRLVAAGLLFPRGAGGLPTMRLVCELVAPIDGGIGDGVEVVFTDRSFPDRLGWREIVAEGDGTTVVTGDTAIAASVSQRLTAYPEDRLQAPLAMTEARLQVTPGGPTLAPFVAPDAQPVGGSVASTAAGVPAVGGVVPGGVGADIPAVFQATDVSPGVMLLAIATALALGAGHALTPGHGKTLMAAYLVGTRGTAVHAVGLGLSVTVSHTLGILALAALVVAAQGVLAPEVVVRWTPLVAALTIVAIGAWMVARELRRRRRAAGASGQPGGHRHDLRHGHGHDHHHADPHTHDPSHEHPPDNARDDRRDDPNEHSHGGVRHTHAPVAGTSITWRSLFALGLAGGIIPSTSALLILLGTIAAGRAAFGVLLVVAFGVGMAVVLGGVGLLLVKGRALLDRLPSRSPLGRAGAWAPLAGATVVFALGIWLTGQALLGRAAL